MTESIPLHRWPMRLQRAIARSHGQMLRRAFVCTETDSTQEAARRMRLRPGDLLAANRQTKGKGRAGRTWVDTREEGVAVTFVLQRNRPERLCLASAVAAAEAIDRALARAGAPLDPLTTTAIKWPNDLLLRGRKLGGILVEQTDDRAYVGIGINVGQTSWPAEIANRAISIAQAGYTIDRVNVIESLIYSLGRTLLKTDEELAAAFAARNALEGCAVTFRYDNDEVAGRLRSINPLADIIIETAPGVEKRIPAAAATVVDYTLG